MKKSDAFDDLRPYCDEEINVAMERLVASEDFRPASAYIFPGRDIERVKQMILDITTIDEFQQKVLRQINEQIITRSIRNFTFSGLDKLDSKQQYLYVSNHRDIMLDASLLNHALLLSGYRTPEITFGSNLMNSQSLIDFGKSNKMFKVIRSATMKDFYNNSCRLSQYIRHTLLNKKESVWIAQRNGRTKNGIDMTDQGIIKMVYLSAQENPIKSLSELNIVPISVSYQWESCDILKTLELYRLYKDGIYKKKHDEDMNSILTGILQYKGDVHIEFGTPITEETLLPFAHLLNNKFNIQIASLIDQQIRNNYRLTNNNYIAYDLLTKTNNYISYYTESEKQDFTQHFEKVMNIKVDEPQKLKDIFLGIYANSCNKFNIIEKEEI